jgi:hypothetical protein
LKGLLLGISAAVLVLVTGCRGKSQPRAASIFAESATPEWTVDSRPRLVIGGNDRVAFYRLGDVVLLGDRMVAANKGTHQVIFLSLSGEVLATQGREGKGPGEYRDVTDIAALDGSRIAVWDRYASRLTLLSRDARVERIVTVVPPTDPRMVRRLRGAVGASFALLESRRQPIPGADDDGSFRERRDSAVFTVVDLTEGAVSVQWAEPGKEVLFGAGPGIAASEPLIFGHDTYATTAGTVAVIGTNDVPMIRFVDPATTDSGSGTEYSFPVPRVPVLPEDVRAVRETLIAENRARQAKDAGGLMVVGGAFGSGKSIIRAQTEFKAKMLAALPASRDMPFYSDLRSDGAGNVWIRAFPEPGRDSVAWAVLDRRRGFVARLVLPRDMELLAIGSENLVARGRNADGADLLEVYGIHR